MKKNNFDNLKHINPNFFVFLVGTLIPTCTVLTAFFLCNPSFPSIQTHLRKKSHNHHHHSKLGNCNSNARYTKNKKAKEKMNKKIKPQTVQEKVWKGKTMKNDAQKQEAIRTLNFTVWQQNAYGRREWMDQH